MESNENKRTADFSSKVSGENYKPYVSPDENIREFTVRAVSYTHLDVYKRQVPESTTWIHFISSASREMN